MKAMAALVLLATAGLFAPSMSRAQELRPLLEMIWNGAERTYSLVRCAGFYLSMLEWAGEDRIGQETSQRLKTTVAGLIDAAADLRAEINHSSSADTIDGVYKDVRAISDLYLLRYRLNYATVGKAWENDATWGSDADLCKILAGG